MSWFSEDTSWFDISKKNSNTNWFDVSKRTSGKGDNDMIFDALVAMLQGLGKAIIGVNDALAKFIRKHIPHWYQQIPIHPLPYALAYFCAAQYFDWTLSNWIPWGIIGALTIAAIWRVYRNTEQNGTFGKAAFAKPNEVKKAGLIDRGLVFGRDDGKHLVTKPDEKDGHVMVLGGSGSGKTKSMALPSLINWTGSAICIDPKGELAEKTAHLRPGKSYIFNPSLEDCDQYNLVSACRTVEAAQDLAQVLMPLSKSGDQFWTRCGQGILAGCLIEGAHRGQSLQEVAQRICMTDDDELRDQLMNSMYDHVPIAASASRSAPDKTLGGIMAELRSHMSVIAVDEQLHMTRNDWSPETLERGDTIYLSIPEHLLNLRQYKAVLTGIISQTIGHLSQRPERKTPPILMLIDEFPRLGHIPQMVESIATLRSRNVHMVLIFQGFSQLDEHYGQNGRKTIVQNCDYKLILKCTEPDTQKYLSDLAGQKTTKSTSTNKDEDEDKTRLSETGVPLIRPEEWGDREPILFTPLTKPIELKRVWYDDPTIQKKIKKIEPKPVKQALEAAATEEKQTGEVIPFPNEKKRGTGA